VGSPEKDGRIWRLVLPTNLVKRGLSLQNRFIYGLIIGELNMRSSDFCLMALVVLSAVMLLIPCNFQAQAAPEGSYYKLEWEKLVKELNLPPKKAAEFQAIGAKYSETRESLIEKLKKNEADLEKVVGEPKPDEAKIKELVPMIIAEHNQLFESFRMQRQEEMTLLTPLQQAKYLLALKKWHEENLETAKAAK
jgi:Spy/CpxP family protein refolding chaperone